MSSNSKFVCFNLCQRGAWSCWEADHTTVGRSSRVTDFATAVSVTGFTYVPLTEALLICLPGAPARFSNARVLTIDAPGDQQVQRDVQRDVRYSGNPNYRAQGKSR